MMFAFIGFTNVLNAWCYHYASRQHFGPERLPQLVRQRIDDSLLVFGAHQRHVWPGRGLVPREVTWVNQQRSQVFVAPAMYQDLDEPVAILWANLSMRLHKADDEGRILWGNRMNYWELAESLRRQDLTVPQFK